MSSEMLSWKQVGGLQDALREPRLCHDQNNEHCLSYCPIPYMAFMCSSIFPTGFGPFLHYHHNSSYERGWMDLFKQEVVRCVHDFDSSRFYTSFSHCSISQSRSRGAREPPFLSCEFCSHLMIYCNDCRNVVFVVLAGPAWNAVRNRTERDRASRGSMLWKRVDIAKVWKVVIFLTS